MPPPRSRQQGLLLAAEQLADLAPGEAAAGRVRAEPELAVGQTGRARRGWGRGSGRHVGPQRLPVGTDARRVDGRDSHIPDFLALTPGAAWLLDVRPGERMKEEDEVRFAAAARAAAAVGWRYAVVMGWHRQVMTGLDALSARRRPMADRLGLQRQVLEVLGRQPRMFGDLVEQTAVPAVARAQAVHLLWHRRMAMDLAQPFGDATWIYPVGRAE